MRKLKTVIFSILFFLILTTINTNAITRTALVIGNGSYQSNPLKNPINDARDMASILQEYDFNVTLLINASQRKMKKAVRSFGKRLLQSGGAGLFYYAGHGMQIKGHNYLIPIGSIIKSEGDVEFESVNAGFILNKMEDSGSDLNIVILDACRNNPYVRSFRFAERGLARMDAPKGSLIAYATAPGSVAADGEGRNGIYTKYLLENIKKPGLTVEQVLKNVRVSVVSATSSNQVPWESSSLMGDFYFNPSRPVPFPVSSSFDSNNVLEEERKRLETEREELEKLKTEIEEQQKKSIKVVSIKPVGKSDGIVDRDGPFVKYENGIIYDNRNGFMWAPTDNGKDINWSDAKLYCRNYKEGGYTDWRMPTAAELATLYEKKIINNNSSTEDWNISYNINRLFHLTCCCPWASNNRGSEAAMFNFSLGRRFWLPQSLFGTRRVIPVRAGK